MSSLISLLTLFKNLSYRVINEFVELRNKDYFKYFEIIGAVYFFRFAVSFVYILKNNLSSILTKKNLKKSYGTGWVIFSDGCSDYVVDISISLIKSSSDYKILLIGFSKDESNLVKNVEQIKRNFNNQKFNKLKVDYLILKKNDKLIFEKEINKKINSSENISEHISIALLNDDYKTMGFFDKFSNYQIEKIINKNIFTNYFLYKFITNRQNPYSDTKFKTLVIAFGDIISKLKLPYFQLYSSSKLALKKELKKSPNIDICYIEDFNKDLIKFNTEKEEKVISLDNFAFNGFAYISFQTKFWFIMLKHNFIVKTIYKNIILEKLKGRNKFNY